MSLGQLIRKRDGLALESSLHRRSAQLKVRILAHELKPYFELASMASRIVIIADIGRRVLSFFARTGKDSESREC